MKKLFKFALSAALGVVAFVGCQKENEAVQPNGNENLVNVTLIAGTPETRTEMDADNKLYWSGKDVIGVTDNVAINGDFANYGFTNNSGTASTTAAFEGSTVTGTLYAYYPYTSNGVSDKGAKVDIPATQSPTVNSFDGKADVLISKPFTVTESTTEVSGLEFRRLTGIVKVVLKNDKLATEHLSSLAMTTENDLVGRVYVDFAKFDIGDDGIYYNAAKTVTANYTEETEFEVNGTNAVYYSVVPTTLAAGSTLIFTGSTESYAIEKTITLPNDIAIEAGKITTLNVTLGDNNIEGSAGLALPFEDDFSWLESLSYINSQALVLADYPSDKYSATAKTYKNAVGELKFGTSSANGSFTTTELDLSEAFTVIVKAKAYNDKDGAKLSITAGNATQTSEILTSDYEEYVFKFDTQDKATITVATDVKRCYVSGFKVIAGHDYVSPPVLKVDVTSLSFTAAGESKIITVEAINTTGDVLVKSSNEAQFSVSEPTGNVYTITAAANNTEKEITGTLTISVDGLTKEVALSQAGKPAEGEDGTTIYTDVLNNKKTGITVTNYENVTISGEPSGAVYSLQCAGGNSSIQLRSSNNNSGIVTSTSGGKVKKITVVWNSATAAARVLDIYGSSTAYTAPSDLYGSTTKGTNLGSIAKSNQTELIIDGDYQYIGLRSRSGAMYIDSITIEWER